MAPPTTSVSSEFARVVWASHILSYLDPYTGTRSHKHLRAAASASGHQRVESDEDDEDLDEDTDIETVTQNAELLTLYDTNVREKFLNCVAELLSHSKGGATVTATALREKEDSVEVDLSRNDGFGAHDERYLSLLAGFLASADIVDTTAGQVETNEGFRSFLETTIDYNANRLDFWIQQAKKYLLKGAPLNLSIPKYSERPYRLRDCTSSGRSIPAVVESLLLKTTYWGASPSDANQVNAERRQIVALSGDAIGSSESTRTQLRSLMPSADPSKIVFWWRRLARPVTILRTLAAITKLFPNFRRVRFIPLKVPPRIKLRTNQIPGIAEAWQNLNLPSSNSFPTRKARKFIEDCSRALAIHCEVQLLMRYESEPWLAPTLAYFGCSKKACFLCDKFLELSALRPRVRGRHGVCHPDWAVPPRCTESMSIVTRDRLIKLCDIIKGQIKLLLKPGSRPAPDIVYQSSAVSELKTADMVHLRQITANREVAEQVAKEHRERMQTLLDPRSVGPQRIMCANVRTVCTMCQWPVSKRCTGCFASWYCSKRCQSIDWPSHKLLCRSFIPFLKSRPSEHCRVGIWFQRDKDKPRLVWVPFSYSERTIYPYFDHFLGPQHMLLWTLPFTTNERRRVILGYYITIYYPDYDEIINKSVHRAVEACHGITVPTHMNGNYVVVSGPPHRSATEHNDMTLTDFRHTLDFFSTYFDDTIREMPSAQSISALKISSPLEHMLYGRETFTSVWVNRGFVSTSNVSDLSVALLGYTIRVCQVKETEMERQSDVNAEGSDWDNPYTKVLMFDIDPSGECWGKVNKWKTKGSAILLREDGLDLDTELAEKMCRYCVDVLQPLFEKALNTEVSPSEVLAEISQGRMSAWMKREEEDDTAIS